MNQRTISNKTNRAAKLESDVQKNLSGYWPWEVFDFGELMSYLFLWSCLQTVLLFWVSNDIFVKMHKDSLEFCKNNVLISD